MMKRRHFLRGSSALFSAPIVGSIYSKLSQDAMAQNPIRRPKFIIYNNANGVQRQKIRESDWSQQGGWELNGILEPLNEHRSDLTVVENLFCHVSRYLHGNASATYTSASRGGGAIGAAGGAPKIVGGISIDQVIANQISKPGENGVRFNGLPLGLPLNLRNSDCVYGTILGTDDNEPLFPKTNALEAYNELFGEIDGAPDPRLAARLAARQSQLDHLRSEVAAASNSLPQPERLKLDQYVSSIRAIEQQLMLRQTEVMSGCVSPEEPARQESDSIRHNDPALWRALVDLGVASLRCGLTNQLSLLHSYGCIHLRYTFNGRTHNHHEEISHEAETGPVMTQILAFHAEHVRHVYSELKESGDADDTVLIWMSDGGGLHHRGSERHSAVILGKPGNIIKTGERIRYPEKTHSLAEFHLTMAKAFGSPIERFGDGQDPGSETLNELLV